MRVLDETWARRLQLAVMTWFSIAFAVAWLPFARSLMDGPTYSWNDQWFGVEFRGSGTGGDFWYATLKAAFAVILLYSGWRRPLQWVRLVLAGWLALGLASIIHGVRTSPEAFRFRGDTLGIDISLHWIAPLLIATMLALSITWAFKTPALPSVPLTRTGKILIAIAAALLPIQYALLSGSTGQQAGDVLGVMLTLFGWGLFCVGLALRPKSGPATTERL